MGSSEGLNNKKGILKISVAFLIVFLCLVTTVVYSINKGEVRIAYKDEVWKTSNTFNLKWFTNQNEDGDKLEFNIDLKDYYSSLENTEGERITPFEITATLNSLKINDVVIDEVLNNNVFEGEYKVSVTLPVGRDSDRINFNITAFQDNYLGIPNSFNKAFYVMRDVTSPRVSISGVSNGNVYNSEQYVDVKVIDTNIITTTLEITSIKDGESSVETFTGNKQIIISDDGDYLIKAIATDKAGNRSDEEKVEFSLNAEAANVAINGEDIKEFYNTSDLKLEVEDSSRLNFEKSKYELTDVLGVTRSDIFKPTNSLNKQGESKLLCEDEGEYTLDVDVYDRYDTRFNKKYSFVIDKTNPVITIDGVTDNGKYTTERKVDIKIEEENNKVNNITVTRNGQAYNMGRLNSKNELRHTFTENGFYEITVNSTDKAENTVSKTMKFTIDKSVPTIVISGVSDTSHYSTDKDVIISINDDNIDNSKNSITVTKNNEKYEVGSFTTENNLATISHQFTEEGSYKLTVNATDTLGNKAEEKVIAFEIDKTKPEVSVSGIEEGKFYNIDTKMTISLKDKNLNVKNINVTKNGEAYAVGEFSGDNNNLQLVHDFKEDGNYSISVIAKDTANNESVSNIYFVVDKTFPEIKIGEGDLVDGVYYNYSKSIRVTIDDKNHDVNTIEVTKDGEKYDVGDISLSGNTAVVKHTFKADGVYKITVNSTDRAKNNSKKSITFTIDNGSPKLELSGVSHGAHYNEDKLIKISIADLNIDSKEVVVKRDGSDVAISDFIVDGITSTLEYTFVEEGSYSIEVKANDKANNNGAINLSFIIDKTKPEIKITNFDEVNNSFNKLSRDVNVQVDETNWQDNMVTVKYEKVLADGTKTEVTPTFESTGAVSKKTYNEFTEDADYIMTITSKDKAGNIAESKNVKLTVDSIQPEILIDGVEDTAHYNTDKDVTFTTNDVNQSINTITVTRNGEAYDVGVFNNSNRVETVMHTFKLEGVYNINITSTDKAGNSQSKSMEFVVDKTKPVINIQNFDSLNNSFNNQDKSVSVKVSEEFWSTNSVSIKYIKTTPDGLHQEIPLEFTSTEKDTLITYSDFNTDAVYELVVSSTDKSGNVADSKSVVFTVDKTNPSIDITGVENDQYYKVDKYVTVKTYDVNQKLNSIEVKQDGQPYDVGNFEVDGRTAVLNHNFSQEGLYEINVKTTDMAGNVMTSNRKFTIDKTAPVITPIFKGDSRVIKNDEYINKIFTPEFKLDKPDDDTIDIVKLNDGDNIRNAVPMASTEMVYNYYVVASDKAQNQTTLKVTFTVDTTNPEVKLTGIVSGFFSENITPKYEITDTNIDGERTEVTLNGEKFESGKTIEKQDHYSFKAVGTDLANNVTNKTITFAIDKDKPVIKFTEPISGEYFTKDFIPNFIIEDLTDYTIISMTLDGNDYTLGDEITEEGKHVLYIEVKDKAGNVEKISVEFILDKTAPKVLFDGIEDGEKYYESISGKIKLDNPKDKIKSVKVNDELVQGNVKEELGQQVINVNFNEIKKYEVKVEAQDEAGNTIEKSINFEVVKKNIFVKLYQNKTIFYPTVGITLVIIIGTVVTILRKRKRSSTEDTE